MAMPESSCSPFAFLGCSIKLCKPELMSASPALAAVTAAGSAPSGLSGTRHASLEVRGVGRGKIEALLEDEVVYCSPAPGYATAMVDGTVRMVPEAEGDGVPRICRVERPVYGMAQAGRRWQRSIFPWLLAWNADSPGAPRLQQSTMDTCVFHCRHTVQTPSGPRSELLLLGCYVDDLFILSSHTDEHSLYHMFTQELEARWDVEDEGDVADLLNVEIERSGDHIILRQRGYVRKLMDTYAPDGVPVSSFAGDIRLSRQQASRVPADASLPQLVLDAPM